MTVTKEDLGTQEEDPRVALTHRNIVLVIDDDEQVTRLVKRVLERAGFECVTVNDGAEAHDAAVTWRPDIILLDLMLGDTTGDQILATLRADFRTRLIPVVFLTVRDSLKDKVEHLLAGADDYVTKPFVPEELVARLLAVMSRSTTRSSGASSPTDSSSILPTVEAMTAPRSDTRGDATDSPSR